MQIYIMRLLKRLIPILPLIIICSGYLFCHISQTDGKALRRAKPKKCFFSDRKQIFLSLQHNNIKAKIDRTRLSLRKSTVNNDSQTGLSGTAMFEAVTGPYGGTVRSIAVDSSGWLFAATDGGVYRSTDNGLHWDLHLFPSQLYNDIEPITILGPNVVAAVTDFSNYISTDRGDSWNFTDLQGFAVDTDGTIYAGSSSAGVQKSTDTAKSWMPFALEGKKIFVVVLAGGGHFVCSSDSGLYYSGDNGTTWTYRNYAGEFNWNIQSDRNGHLFIIQDFQVYTSSDFGNTWNLVVLPGTGEEDDVYRINIERNNRIFVPTDTRILMSSDLGETWNALAFPNGEALTVGEDAHGDLLAGSFYGLYRLDQASGEWEELDNGIHAQRIETIQFTSAGSILVLSLGRYFRSSDGGSSWSKMNFDSTVDVNAYAPMISSSSGSIFVEAYFDSGGGLLRSDDDGLSWKKIPVLSNYYAIYCITERVPGEILAGTYFGDIYRSTNNGDSWSKVVSSSTEAEIFCIASDKAGNSYAAGDTSMLVSNDGTMWKEVSMREGYAFGESIAIDTRGDVFLGTATYGVNHSTDQGKTWNLMDDGLNDTYVMSTVADDSNNVFLGTAYGIYRLADSVDEWEDFWYRIPFYIYHNSFHFS